MKYDDNSPIRKMVVALSALQWLRLPALFLVGCFTATGSAEVLVQAGARLALPELEIMPSSDVEACVAGFDAEVYSGSLRLIIDQLLMMSQPVPSGAGYDLEGTRVPRFDSAEITERLIGLYLSEADAYQRMIHSPLSAVDFRDVSGESELLQDYLDLLAPLALMTFSPNLYETALTFDWGGKARLLYLAMVNPAKTLDCLLELRLRPPLDEIDSPDALEHPAARLKLGTVATALELLSLLAKYSPDAVQHRAAETLGFLRHLSKHYLAPVIRSYRPEPVYRRILDIRARLASLAALSALRQAVDVYDLYEDARSLLMDIVPAGPADREAHLLMQDGETLLRGITESDDFTRALSQRKND